jgi:hypothetical protein
LWSLHKWLEDTREQLRLEADSVISNLGDNVTFASRYEQRDVPTGIGVLRRVAKQIGEYLGQPRRVAIDDKRGRRDLELEVVPLHFHERAGDFDGLRDRVAKIDDLGPKLELSLGDARDIEQVVDQMRDLLDLAFDDLQLSG